MNSLISTQGNMPVVLSTTVAEQFGRQHKNVLQKLDSLAGDGTISRLEFKLRDYEDSRGKTQRVYELNKAGFLKAMPFIGGRKSRQGQKTLIDEFMRLRELSEHLRPAEWLLARSKNKQARYTETSVIQQFIDYAVQQGSKGASHYYQNLSKLTNKILCITAGQRDSLNVAQLGMLTTAEHLISVTLIEGMQNGLHYRSIYLLVKERLQTLGQALGSALSPDHGGKIINASDCTGEI